MSLQVNNLSKAYGGVQALDDVSFYVEPGECVALIGPNGAGKSTCFACIAGQVSPSAGAVLWLGQSLKALSPAQRVQRGVGRSFQVAQVFESLTVAQNLSLQNKEQENEWINGQLREFIQKLGLEALQNTRAADLPYGAKKRLELAMALSLRPKLLLLDEPAAGLSEAERASLMAVVQDIAASGVAVLYTEHNMDAVFGIAQRVLVLIDGKLVANASAEAVRADKTVQQRYLGQSLARVQVEKTATVPTKTALQVQNLNAHWGEAQALFNVNLTLKSGHCTLLRGLNGAGKSTLLQAICGVGPRVQGELLFNGKAVGDWPAHKRAQAGMGWVAEDRRLFVGLSVAQNLHIAARGDSALQLERCLQLFPALKPMLKRPASQMSGGEQQMLAIARTLMTQPSLLLLDEPCEGIAPVLVDAIVAAIAQLKREGMTLLVAEQHQAFDALADEVLMLQSGGVVVGQD